MTDERRDELLLQIFGQTSEMRGHITRLQGHIEALNGRVLDVGQSVAKVAERVQDHTSRIDLLESANRDHDDWKSKIKGGYWAIGVLAAALATGAGILIGLLK